MNQKKALHQRIKTITEKKRLQAGVTSELSKLKEQLVGEILKTKSKIKTEKS